MTTIKRTIQWIEPLDDYQPSSPTKTPSLEDLKTQLAPLHAHFSTAAIASPARAVTAVTLLSETIEGRPDVYRLEVTSDDFSAEVTSSAPAAVKRAYIHYFLCGIACWVVTDALKKILSKYKVQVQMITVRPLAKLCMFLPERKIEIEQHAALKITFPCGAEFVLDFTHGQFGHDSDDWLILLSEYLNNYVFSEGETEPYRIASDIEEANAIWMAKERCDGYWEKVKNNLDCLTMFKGWKAFRLKSKEQQQEYVSSQCLKIKQEYLKSRP